MRSSANISRSALTKKFSGSLRVPRNTCRFSFADLDGSSGEVDEPLDASGFWSRSTKRVPEVLPGFMCFPVEASVEEVEGVEPGRVGGEEGGKGTATRVWIGG
jgi:hypothetical protein